jgi:small subunit ribosomal protein S14
MAKESVKARERKREHLVAKYAAKRKALKVAQARFSGTSS